MKLVFDFGHLKGKELPIAEAPGTGRKPFAVRWQAQRDTALDVSSVNRIQSAVAASLCRRTAKFQLWTLDDFPMTKKSIQETYAPRLACFGCGPANEIGLHIRSFPSGDEVVAEWQPKPEYESFTGMLSGGIIGTLLDCHCNWTAAWHLMKKPGLDHPPCTVTAEYSIKLLRPTPSDKTVRLVARVVESTDDRAIVEAELMAHDKVCATCRGTFVAVKPGHAAYHRW